MPSLVVLMIGTNCEFGSQSRTLYESGPLLLPSLPLDLRNIGLLSSESAAHHLTAEECTSDLPEGRLTKVAL